MKQTLKIGFDLDGVILYNPARIIRPFIAAFKKYVLKKRKLIFYYPKSSIEKKLWYFFHKSSFLPSPGIKEIEELVKNKKIKAYLITARYSFLKDDLENCLQKWKLKNLFEGVYYNKNDLQPHIFKEKVIKKLNLDIFVEDNWDIVSYLYKKFKKSNKKVKIFWIYNLFDKKIKYNYKFPDLKTVISRLKK